MSRGRKKILDIDGFRYYLQENELSPSTVQRYIGTIQVFSASYGEVTKRNMLDFKEKLIAYYSPKTVNLKLSAVRSYCAYAGIPYKVKQVKMHRISHIENVITTEQYKKLIGGLEQDGKIRWVVNIKMISMTGARISEALRITKADVMKGYATMHTKGKVRTIQIPVSLVKDIAEYIEPLANDDVIIRNRCGEPMSRQSYEKVLKYFSRYGIPEDVLHPHSFRHFFAIKFLKRNNNVSLLADILGHSNVNTTMIYLRMSQEQQKRAIDEAVDW